MKVFKSGYNELQQTPKIIQFSTTSQCCASGTSDCEPDEVTNKKINKIIKEKKIVAYDIIKRHCGRPC